MSNANPYHRRRLNQQPAKSDTVQHLPRDLQQDITINELLYDFCGDGAGPDDQGCTCTNVDGLSFTVTCLEVEGGPRCDTYYNKCGASVSSLKSLRCTAS